MFKGFGYLISSVSVMLLAISSWDGVKDKPLLLACLIAGVITSIGGMLMRWVSFRRDEKPSRGSATASKSGTLSEAPRPVPARAHGSGAQRPTGR